MTWVVKKGTGKNYLYVTPSCSVSLWINHECMQATRVSGSTLRSCHFIWVMLKTRHYISIQI